ncbi:TAG lipase [Sporothrix schenckii 1099-18]|uniref:TAG lipase n=1 Tax=Sporothrix schenckii 1099-18 TaxID=1397361 RepID=A0A0F2MK08_SPOSC|nr:TAG lipase [Sporothrix schenckii 1099-18]KJR88511.1 TAG lipase [Sporothrix schenckii 1099-18]
MGDFLLLPREGGRDGDAASNGLPSIRSLAGLLKRARAQQSAPKPANATRRIPSLATRLSESLQARVNQSREARRASQERHERQQILELRMANATTYQEWEAAAHLLDELDEHETWKASSDSDEFYNPDLVQARLKDLEDARLSSDIRRMMHLVRTALSRDVGGISSAGLYSHTHTGTKYLVERYAQASVDLIHALVDRSRSAAALPKGLTHREMLDQLLLARRSYGRSALVLSGGSVYGMAHIGVMKALFDRGLLPRIISGTSAGSIVAAVVCTRTDEEIPALLTRFAHGDLAVFTDKDNPDSWLTHIGRALRYGAWHDSRHIARVMRDLLGDMTFQEAFNRTRRILNITVSSKPGLQLPSLLNYLTAPDVIIWSAVVASCSIPGVFDPRPLLVRDAETGEHVPWDPAEQLWIDGSLDNDVPVERLGEMLNVNHFIVSQTNPHIVLFVSNTETLDAPHDGSASSSAPSIGEILYTLGWLSKSEAIYYLETLVDMGLFRGSLSMLLQMLNQRYTADINILPRMSLAWGTNLIRNPTTEFMLEACRVGEQATWPSISRIEQACAVEVALDKAVHTLRERIAFSDSQVNLRRFFTGSYELGVRGNSLYGGAPLVGTTWDTAAAINASARASACTVDGNDGDTDPTSTNNMMSPLDGHHLTPTSRRSRSPVAHRHSQHLHNQLLSHSHHRQHKRRGSGGSIQMSARRRHNRHALETILSEDSGGTQDSDAHLLADDGGLSLAVRRGMADMNLSAFFDNKDGGGGAGGSDGDGGNGRPRLTHSVSYYGVPPHTSSSQVAGAGYSHHIPSQLHQRSPAAYRGAVKQNSLQQLPMPTPASASTQTPSPTTSFTRKGYNWGFGDRSVGGLTPFAQFGPTDNGDGAADEDDGSPVLQMKAQQRRQRRNSSTSSAVSAVSAAAAAAVAAAHHAVMQAVSGGGGASDAPATASMTTPQSPRAQRMQPFPTSAGVVPRMTRVSSTTWYPGVVPPSLARRASHDESSEETQEEDEDDTSGDCDPYEGDGTESTTHEQATTKTSHTPPRPVRLVRRCKSVPSMAVNDGGALEKGKQRSRHHQQHVAAAAAARATPHTPHKPPSTTRAPSQESVEHDHTEVEDEEDEEDDMLDGGDDTRGSNSDVDDGDVFMSGSGRQTQKRPRFPAAETLSSD